MKRFLRKVKALFLMLTAWTFCIPVYSATNSPSPPYATFLHDAMGTVFEFTLYARPSDASADDLQPIVDDAFAVIDDLDERISVWRNDSQVTYINHHAADEPVKAAADVIDLLLYTKCIWKDTGGAFDPTIGPLLEMWGFYKKNGTLPSGAQIQESLGKIGMDGVDINRTERTVQFTRQGIRLDFGGIGKGLALDRAAEILRRRSVVSGLLNAGTSSVVAIGAPPNKKGWLVRIRNPYENNKWVDEVMLKDASLSTSGNYEKFFEIQGKRYCHIFDPHTGKPVENMLSTTAIAPSGTETDALSTAFFVMGVDAVKRYCSAHPEVSAILIPMQEGPNPKPIRLQIPQEVKKP